VAKTAAQAAHATRQEANLPDDSRSGRHIDSKSEAMLVAAQIRVAILARTFRPAARRRDEQTPDRAGSHQETLRDYARAWLSTTAAQNLKTSTVRFYADALDNHVLPLLGERPICDVNRADCRNLIVVARARGLRVSTVRGIVRTLSSVLSQAVEDGRLPANPALRPGRYLRRGEEAESQIDPMTREEVTRLLAVAAEHFPDWRPFLLCGVRTGMRLGELLALKWSDIDWRGSTLYVQRNLVRRQLTTPKSHQNRKVDVSRQLRIGLKLHLRRQRAVWRELGAPVPEWVFASTVGTPLDEANVRKALNRILEEAGMRQRGPHQMRHTFASLVLQAGEPITYVSNQLGHKDSAITLRVYAHWLPNVGGRRGVDQ
jgi:integrase